MLFIHLCKLSLLFWWFPVEEWWVKSKCLGQIPVVHLLVKKRKCHHHQSFSSQTTHHLNGEREALRKLDIILILPSKQHNWNFKTMSNVSQIPWPRRLSSTQLILLTRDSLICFKLPHATMLQSLLKLKQGPFLRWLGCSVCFQVIVWLGHSSCRIWLFNPLLKIWPIHLFRGQHWLWSQYYHLPLWSINYFLPNPLGKYAAPTILSMFGILKEKWVDLIRLDTELSRNDSF